MKIGNQELSMHSDRNPTVQVLASTALGIAVLDLVGWTFHISVLTSAVPGYATMKPNTALCLGLLALSLLLASPSRWRRFSAVCVTLLALSVSTLSLIEYLFGRDLGIDQILIAVPPDRFLDPAGRMSFGTSLALLFTGVALLCQDRFPDISVSASSAGLIISIAALFGFALHAGPLVSVPRLRSLAVHTAAALGMLQIAILASRPHHEPVYTLLLQWKRAGSRRFLLIAITLLPVLLAVPVLLGFRAGQYDAPFALALLVVLLMLLQTGTLWFDNRQLSLVEGELRRSESHSSRILQSIGDAVIVTDAQGTVVRMNEQAEAMTGWLLERARGRALRDIFVVYNGQTRAPGEDPIEEVTRLGNASSLASGTVLQGRDGRDFHIEATGAPIREEDGTCSGIVLVFRSVDERNAAEQQVQRATERLQIALQTAGLGQWELNLADLTLECSAACKANFGKSRDDAFSYADLLQLIHPEDREAVRQAVQNAVESNLTYRAEYRVFWPDASCHWIVASGKPLYDVAGVPVSIVGVTMDVTERHDTFAALMQTEKLAAVGRLASSIAHEINNPLESVTNLLYLARCEATEPALQGYLDDAERELRRVSAISNQTLRFYKQATRPRWTDPAELIDNVLSVYQGKLANSQITVDIRKHAAPLIFCLDGEIRQVLSNLIGNAIDAMAGMRGRLILSTRPGRDWATGRTGVVFSIADTGSGMSRTTLGKIFEPFFSTKGLSGTGLGLWISKDLVARHHGTLRVRSREQVGASGTVFKFFLPSNAADQTFERQDAGIDRRTPSQTG